MNNIPIFENLEPRLLLSNDLLYTIGDTNLDDIVNSNDLQAVITNIGNTNASWSQGDINSDNVVDAFDFITLKRNFGKENIISAEIKNDVLVVSGTNHGEGITITQEVNGTSVNNIFLPENYNSISLSSFGGNDTVKINYSIRKPSVIFAGDGDDTVYENSQGSSNIDGGNGNDLIITVGGGSDIVSGGEGVDSFWVDSADTISNVEAAEVQYNVHRIIQFYLPAANSRPSLEINGQDLVDPVASVPYVNMSSDPLWTDGPQYNDIRQGNVGDCYFVASLSSLADSDPLILQQMITSLGDGTFAVRYYRGGVANYVRIDSQLPVSGSDLYYAKKTPSGELWVALVEKAYAQFRWGQNSYASLNTGHAGTVYTDITNAQITYISIDAETALNSLAQSISSNLQSGHAIAGATIATPATHLVGSHVYEVKAITDVDGQWMVTVYNPWGYILTISLSVFKDNFFAITICLA